MTDSVWKKFQLILGKQKVGQTGQTSDLFGKPLDFVLGKIQESQPSEISDLLRQVTEFIAVKPEFFKIRQRTNACWQVIKRIAPKVKDS